MKRQLVTKGVLALVVLVAAVLCLVLRPFDSVNAGPPDPPPTLVWERLEPPYPPTEVPSPAVWIAAQGTSKTFHAVADAEVQQGNPMENYGIEPTMGIGYDNYTSEKHLIQRALLHFNVSAFLPPGTTIHQATLRLYMVGYCDVGSSSFRVHRVADDWSELTVSWNNQPSSAEGYGQAVIPAPPPPPPPGTWDWYNFDVTSLAQSWVNGDYPEYGLMIRGPETTPYPCAFRNFLTKGGGGYTVAPELAVDYTLPAPAMAVSQNDVIFLHQCGVGAPAPSPQVVAVQSNDTTLNDWTASVIGGDNWLSLSKAGGKLSRIFPDQIEISVTETISCPDIATAQIQISAPGLGDSPQTVNVTLQQSENPLHQIYLPLVAKNHTGLSSSISTASTTDRIALLIGVADYFYLEPPATFSVLRSGVWGDDLLAQPGDLRATQQDLLPDFDTKVILSEEHAMKEYVDYAFQRIDEWEDEDTEVLVYITGHGGQIADVPPLDEADDQDELLGVYDTNDTPEFVNHILDDNFKTQLANLETEYLAVIIDACNSGGMEVINPHRAVLAAAQEDQNSWESSELEHGVFTYYMLQAALDPASDTNGDCWLSVQEIYDYARDLVADYVWDNESAEQDLTLDQTRDFKVMRVCP